MTQEQKDTLNEYARIKIDAGILDTKVEELKSQVLAIMEESGAEEIELADYGKLSIGSRRTYTYSKFIQDKDKDLKEAKKIEERTGSAEYQEKKFVLFKGLKEE